MVGGIRVLNATTSGEWNLTVQVCMLNCKYVQMYFEMYVHQVCQGCCTYIRCVRDVVRTSGVSGMLYVH